MEQFSSLSQPKFEKEPVNTRPFSRDDADFIVASISAHPKNSVYDCIVGKTLAVQDTKEHLQEIYSNLCEQLDDFAKLFGLNYQSFEGGEWKDEDDLRHKFSNPKSLEVRNWLFYSAKRLDQDEHYSHEPIKKRIYLHPKIEHWFKIWPVLLQLLEQDKTLRQVGYQSKVANFYKVVPSLFGQMKNQHDRILFYFGEAGIDPALNIITQFVSKNQDLFENSHSLAMPLHDNNGKKLTGIFLADEVEEVHGSSFNEAHSNIINSLLMEFQTIYIEGVNIREVLAADLTLQKLLKDYLVKNYPNKLKEYGFREDNTALLAN